MRERLFFLSLLLGLGACASQVPYAQWRHERSVAGSGMPTFPRNEDRSAWVLQGRP